MLTKSLVEAIESQDWVVMGWKIKFLLSEKLLYHLKQLSRADDWYEDPVIIATVMDRLEICFTSIREYYSRFGILPHVSDRLFDEDSGMLIQDRSIDGGLKTLTFTLGL